MRERLAALTRKCRHPAQRLKALHTGMYLIGCTYNFCWPHETLSKPEAGDTPNALGVHAPQPSPVA